jgi:hypothetical protein
VTSLASFSSFSSFSSREFDILDVAAAVEEMLDSYHWHLRGAQPIPCSWISQIANWRLAIYK